MKLSQLSRTDRNFIATMKPEVRARFLEVLAAGGIRGGSDAQPAAAPAAAPAPPSPAPTETPAAAPTPAPDPTTPTPSSAPAAPAAPPSAEPPKAPAAAAPDAKPDAKPADEQKSEPGESSSKSGEPEKLGALELKAEPLAITLPEGVEVPKERVTEFETYVNQLREKHEGVTPELASDLAAAFFERDAQAAQAVVVQDRTWLEELKADEKFGGKNWDVTHANAVKALKAYPEAQAAYEALNEKGYGSLPPFIKFLAQVGARRNEDDSAVDGHQPSAPTREQMLRARYNNTPA